MIEESWVGDTVLLLSSINGQISVTADLTVIAFPYLISVTMMPRLFQHDDDNELYKDSKICEY